MLGSRFRLAGNPLFALSRPIVRSFVKIKVPGIDVPIEVPEEELTPKELKELQTPHVDPPVHRKKKQRSFLEEEDDDEETKYVGGGEYYDERQLAKLTYDDYRQLEKDYINPNENQFMDSDDVYESDSDFDVDMDVDEFIAKFEKSGQGRIVKGDDFKPDVTEIPHNLYSYKYKTKAQWLWEQIHKEGISPQEIYRLVTIPPNRRALLIQHINVAVDAVTSNVLPGESKSLLKFMRMHGFEITPEHYEKHVICLAKSGLIQEASTLISTLKLTPTANMYDAYIHFFANNAKIHKAQMVLKNKFRAQNIKPTLETYKIFVDGLTKASALNIDQIKEEMKTDAIEVPESFFLKQ